MKEYRRNPACECANYTDRATMNLQDRLNKKSFWQDGYIHENDTSRECNCHKIFRLGGRYDRIAEKSGLPSYEELTKLTYLGTSDAYSKLKSLPGTVRTHNLQDVLVYVNGRAGNQKTTSLAKLAYSIVLDGMTVSYISYVDLIEAFLNKSENLSEILSTDWLLIDDCFEGETINFKSVYNQFYNAILKRRKPTVLATSYSRENLMKAKGITSYVPDMLEKMFTKVDKYRSEIEFTDNVDKLLLTEQRIDIWNM